MEKTYSVSKKELSPNWVTFDASGQVLGRLATQVASVLMGKAKSNFTTHINVGDKVIVINAEKIKVTGNKSEAKKYYRHSGYPGGFREETLGSLLERKPEDIIKNAVWGMLPTNKLRAVRFANLYVYKGDKHKHAGQVK